MDKTYMAPGLEQQRRTAVRRAGAARAAMSGLRTHKGWPPQHDGDDGNIQVADGGALGKTLAGGSQRTNRQSSFAAIAAAVEFPRCASAPLCWVTGATGQRVGRGAGDGGHGLGIAGTAKQDS